LNKRNASKFINNYPHQLDMIIMDPPRKGSDEKFLSSVLSRKPKQIIYISCDPETLARDILYLKDKYQVTFVQPVDMFPIDSCVYEFL